MVAFADLLNPAVGGFSPRPTLTHVAHRAGTASNPLTISTHHISSEAIHSHTSPLRSPPPSSSSSSSSPGPTDDSPSVSVRVCGSGALTRPLRLISSTSTDAHAPRNGRSPTPQGPISPLPRSAGQPSAHHHNCPLPPAARPPSTLPCRLIPAGF